MTLFMKLTEKLAYLESMILPFRIEKPRHFVLSLHASSTTDWAVEGKEACLLELTVHHKTEDTEIKFHVVTYMGEITHAYKAYLGFLEEGDYELKVQQIVVPEYGHAITTVHHVHLSELHLTEQENLIYHHLPFLYGRNHFTEYDSCYTDTPLAFMYSYVEKDHLIELTYECIFSHEDEGTPAPLLLAKWGRLTDIEWCYKVVIDTYTNKVLKRSYQGPHHEELEFTGNFICGTERPILQVRTTNGNFDQEIDANYCFSLLPKISWDKQSEPREYFMKSFDHYNLVMMKEAERQLLGENALIEHPIHYLYVFFYLEETAGSVAIDLEYEKNTTTYSSSLDFYDEDYGYGTYTGGQSIFTIAIKGKEKDIEHMQVRLLSGQEVVIRQIIFHQLKTNGHFDEIREISRSIFLTKDNNKLRLKEYL